MNTVEVPPFPIFDLARKTVIGMASHPKKSGAVLAALIIANTTPTISYAQDHEASALPTGYQVDPVGIPPSDKSIWIGYGTNVWDQMIAAGYLPAEVIQDINYQGIPEKFHPQWWTPDPRTVATRDARMLYGDLTGPVAGAQTGSTRGGNHMITAYTIIANSLKVDGVLTPEAAEQALWFINLSDERPNYDAMDFPNPEGFIKFPRPSAAIPYLSHGTSCTTEHYAKPAGILVGLLAIAAYEHLLQHPQYEKYRFTVLVVADMVSGDHQTHLWGNKVDLLSAQITSGGNGADGPFGNMKSPMYDDQFTQDMVTILKGSYAPDGKFLVPLIKYSDNAITGVKDYWGHWDHLHVESSVSRDEQPSYGNPNATQATPNTGPWCQYEDVWADWDVDPLLTQRALYPVNAPVSTEPPVVEVEATPEPVIGSAAIPTPVAVPPPPPVEVIPPPPTAEQFVNSLNYQVGNAEPFIQAYRATAAARGWSVEAIDAWQAWAVDIAGKESGFCWNVLRGAQLTGNGCELKKQGKFEDAGFGQVIKLHLPMLAQMEGIHTTEEIIASPWNSMRVLLRLLEQYGNDPWCYDDYARGFHDCWLAPSGTPV